MIRFLSTVLRRRRITQLAVLLVLASFGAQQWAVRAHWHAPVTASAEAAQPAGQQVPEEGQGQPHPDCLWCHAAAHAAAAPPVHWAGLSATAFHSFIRPPAGAMAEFLPPPSWAWHSRGPPAA